MEIIPCVYQITIRRANIVLIAEKELTLIDTGFRGSSPQILSFIHRLRLPPKMVTTNLRQAIDSVNKMAQLDFDILCFGHGSPVTKDASAKVRQLAETSATTLS